MSNYSDKIYLYIDNELSESEKLDFEREMEVNANLRQEFKLAQMAENLMAEQARHLKIEKEVASIFANLPEVIIEEEEPKPLFEARRPNYFRIISIAASIIIIVGLGIWFFTPSKESALNYYADYQVEGREMSGIADINVLINTYLEAKEKGNYQVVLDSVVRFQPKDSSENYVYFSIKSSAEAHLKKYNEALSSLENEAKYAKKPQQKINIQINRVVILWEMGEKEKAKKELESLLLVPDVPQNVHDLQRFFQSNEK